MSAQPQRRLTLASSKFGATSCMATVPHPTTVVNTVVRSLYTTTLSGRQACWLEDLANFDALIAGDKMIVTDCLSRSFALNSIAITTALPLIDFDFGLLLTTANWPVTLQRPYSKPE